VYRGRGRWYGRWYKHGWWCPMHPWPPAWAGAYWAPATPYYPAPIDPREELTMLETMKKDLNENLKELEARIKELKEMIEKEKTK